MSSKNGCHTVKSQRALAKSLKISRSTVARLIEDGLEPKNGHGYSLDQARKLLAIRALRGRAIASDPDALELKRQKLAVDLEIARMELAVSKGDFVERATVVATWRKGVISVRNALLGMSRCLTPLIHGKGMCEIKIVVDQYIFQTLRLLANPEHYPVQELERDIQTPKEANT